MATEEKEEPIGEGEGRRIHQDRGLVEKCNAMEEAELLGIVEQVREATTKDARSSGMRGRCSGSIRNICGGGRRDILMEVVVAQNNDKKQNEREVDRREKEEATYGLGGRIQEIVCSLAN